MSNRCNCENNACSHVAGACRLSAESDKRLQYVGAVCLPCWSRADSRYRAVRMPTRVEIPTVKRLRRVVGRYVWGKADLNLMCLTDTGRVCGGELW